MTSRRWALRARKTACGEATGNGLAFRYEGAAKIREALAASTEKVTVVFQQIAPPLVTVASSGRASARTSVTELLRSEGDGVLRLVFGVYADELIEQDGRWLFAHRRFELRHQMPTS